jgi:hypothetical protein
LTASSGCFIGVLLCAHQTDSFVFGFRIARLATEHSNRQTMAKHKGLITTIARATEREAKLELNDASSSTQRQAFLGKPLLLSLLMAM